MSSEEKDVPQNTQDLTVFVQNLLQQMVRAPRSAPPDRAHCARATPRRAGRARRTASARKASACVAAAARR
jgi:hypothetical protein